MQWRDFTGGPVVKNLPSSARDTGSTLDQRNKIPRTMRQLRLLAAIKIKIK